VKTKAVLFDLCDTLFLFDSQRLPFIIINGQEVRSTTGLVYETFCRHTSVSFEAFYQSFVETTQEITRVREQDYREITSLEKFKRVLHRLNLGPTQVPETVLTRIVLTHMNALATALHLPHTHRILIERIRGKYPLGIITNFDHTPTVNQLLVRENLEDYFEPVVISAEVGWRKPRREIFQKALDLLGIKAAETVFVGNDLKIDVVGAHTVGIPTVWFNRRNEAPGPHDPLPDYTVSRLEDIQNIL
jgi:putative hydrolase of the HAD superfamily